MNAYEVKVKVADRIESIGVLADDPQTAIDLAIKNYKRVGCGYIVLNVAFLIRIDERQPK